MRTGQFYLVLMSTGLGWAALGGWTAGVPGAFLGWLGVILGAVVRGVKADLDDLNRTVPPAPSDVPEQP